MEGKGSFFYPSVECGPINNLKSKQILGFKPTNVYEAIKKTCQFFKTAEGFTNENKKATKKVNKAVKLK